MKDLLHQFQKVFKKNILLKQTFFLGTNIDFYNEKDIDELEAIGIQELQHACFVLGKLFNIQTNK